MHTISILGTGNLATHLFKAFKAAGTIEVQHVFGRSPKKLEPSGKAAAALSALKNKTPPDVYLVAVADTAIAAVSAMLGNSEKLVVHTSGSVAMDTLNTRRKGVFYPLQTFTKGRELDFSSIPICLEAENEDDYHLLEIMANAISRNVRRIDTPQRQNLHLAAVFANNFTNHLFHIAKEICKKNNIDFDILYPLITETIEKIRFLDPKDAQTGPAQRNDVDTMQRHLDSLEHTVDKRVYQILSESIRRG